jgi:hypothetical protein
VPVAWSFEELLGALPGFFGGSHASSCRFLATRRMNLGSSPQSCRCCLSYTQTPVGECSVKASSPRGQAESAGHAPVSLVRGVAVLRVSLCG